MESIQYYSFCKGACEFFLILSMIVFSFPHQVVKAQLQEQKFLQRMLEDRGESVKGIEATAAELVKAASPEDREQVPTAECAISVRGG